MSENNPLIPFNSAPGWLQPQLERFSRMDVKQLQAELAQSLQMTAQGLMTSAALVRILEEQHGVDLKGLKISLIPWLRLIAHNQLLPEVVVRFAGNTRLLDRIAGLPLPDQFRLAAGEHVPLVVFDDSGKRTHRMVDPLDMRPPQLAQVFGQGFLRTEAQQLLYLDDRRERAATPVPDQVGIIRLDVEAQQAIIGRYRISLSDLEKAVRLLRRSRQRRG